MMFCGMLDQSNAGLDYRNTQASYESWELQQIGIVPGAACCPS